MNPQLKATTADGLPVPPRRPGRTRLGVMGGTFDPIHHGHLVAASEVASVFDLDEVVFVPTGQPWQKADKQVSSAEHRYLMTVVATASNPRFTVSRVDIDRPGPTYTVDTLRDLREIRPNADLFFITGADAMAQVLSWKDAAEMWDLAYFVGVTRPGHELSAPYHGDGVGLLEVPAMAISSTDVRRRSAAGKPVWYLVPDGVVQYINKYNLYDPHEDSGDDNNRRNPDRLPGDHDAMTTPVDSRRAH
ncbi:MULTISPECIES: nicotinate-nucleotide adenylyltransferase [Micrococcaceae]|uniref:nicotinate-nucleotide adenylyltransferase n=1 Tax=unclassified Kocuria TaxID=2649579 RepID=UPI0010107EB5|nr:MULTISPECIES: nicotinate-nucleotide adenylyltransferase [unclassified Kocuria]